MTSTPALRAFLPSDATSLTEMLHRAYAELGAAGLNFTAVDQDVATTLRRVGGGSSWVLDDGAGGILGAVTMTFPPEAGLRAISREARTPGRAWLNQLAVDPSARARGLASTLWSTARTWARAQGATHVGLDTAVPADRLHALYLGWGFVDVETVRWPGKTYASRVMLLDLSTVG